MKRLLIFLLLLVSPVLAGPNPNFTGTWVLDKSRSFSNPPGLEQTIVVVHNGDQIKFDTKLTTERGGTVQINEVYMLDGKQTDFTTTPLPNTPPNKGKRTSSWLPGGKGILIVDEVTRETPQGPSTDKTTRKWTLSPDGTTLTINYYIDNPRGTAEAKRVFVKQ